MSRQALILILFVSLCIGLSGCKAEELPTESGCTAVFLCADAKLCLSNQSCIADCYCETQCGERDSDCMAACAAAPSEEMTAAIDAYQELRSCMTAKVCTDLECAESYCAEAHATCFEAEATDPEPEELNRASVSEDVSSSVSEGELQVTLKADHLEGNAPLTVQFSTEILGLPPERIGISWDFGGGTTSSQPEPIFTFYSPLDYTVTVEVFDTVNPTVVAEDSVVIRVRQPADLAVESFSLSEGTEYAPGDKVLVDVKLKNRGGTVEEGTKLAIYLSDDEVLKTDLDQRVLDHDLGPLAEGVEIDLEDFEVPLPEGLEDGVYFVFAFVDPDDDVTELDETNNQYVAPDFISVDSSAKTRPDLVLSELIYEPGLVVSNGEKLSYSFKISNQGDGEAKSFRFATFLSVDEVYDESDVEISDEASSKVFVHKPGVTLPIFRGFDVPDDIPGGYYYLVVVVDPDKVVLETDEGNNEVVAPYTFKVEQQETLGKDLELLSMDVPTKGTYWGGGVKVDMEIRNTGNQPVIGAKGNAFLTEDQSINANVDFPLGEPEGFELPTIPPGETVDFSVVLTVDGDVPLKDFYVGVVLDLANNVSELDEANNFGVHDSTLKVEQTATVELAALSVEFHPTTVNAGEEFTVSYKVENQGSSNSGAFDAWLVLSADTVFSTSEITAGFDLLLSSMSVSDITGGEQIEMTAKVVVPVSLPHDQTTYRVGLLVDPDGKLQKDGGENNTAIAAESLTVVGAQGGCFEDSLEENDASFDAQEISAGLTTGSLCDSADWFKIQVPAGNSLTLSLETESILSLDEINPDLDMRLYDENAQLVDEGHQKGSMESVSTFAAAVDTTFFVQLYPRTPGNKASYELNAILSAPAEGVDIFVKDVDVIPELSFPGGIIAAKVHLYNLGAEAADTFEINLTLSADHLPSDDDVLLDSFTVSTIFAAADLQITRNLLLPSVPGGAYRVLASADVTNVVEEADESNNSGFSGEIVLNEALACIDDDFEPNNGFPVSTKFEANSGIYSDLVVCPGLEDWYSVDLELGESMQANVTHSTDSSAGPVYVDLYAPDGVTVIDTATSQNALQVALPYVFESGTYYVRVYHSGMGAQPAPITYGFGISVSEAVAESVCEPDVYEPNWAKVDAQPLGCGMQKLTLCQKDRDVFVVDLPPGQTAEFTIEQVDGALRMDVYEDMDMAPILSIEGNGGQSYLPESAKSLYVVVTPIDGWSGMTSYDYSLFMDGISGTDLDLGDLTPYPGEVVQGEDTFLSFSVRNQCLDAPNVGTDYMGVVDYRVYLSEDAEYEETDTMIYDGQVSGVMGHTTVELAQKVTIPQDAPLGPVSLFLVVDPLDIVQESNEWNNLVSVALEVLELCVDDAFEPNNVPNYAQNVEQGTLEGLALCSADFDWYKFDTTSGRQVVLNLDFDSTDSDLDMRLYHESNILTPVASSLGLETGENITYETIQSGTFYIRVNGFDGSAGAYSLDITY